MGDPYSPKVSPEGSVNLTKTSVQGKLLNLDLEVIMMPNLISVQSNKKELKS